MDYSLLELIPATEADYEFSYRVKKEAEGRIITEVFGWDEKRQRDFFNNEWQTIPRNIITYKGKYLGTISVTEDEEGIQIRTFFLFPEYQNRGIGSYLLKKTLEEADRAEKTARLQFLKNNPAKSLYLRFGFQIVREDNLFYYARRETKKEAISGKEN